MSEQKPKRKGLIAVVVIIAVIAGGLTIFFISSSSSATENPNNPAVIARKQNAAIMDAFSVQTTPIAGRGMNYYGNGWFGASTAAFDIASGLPRICYIRYGDPSYYTKDYLSIAIAESLKSSMNVDLAINTMIVFTHCNLTSFAGLASSLSPPITKFAIYRENTSGDKFFASSSTSFPSSVWFIDAKNLDIAKAQSMGINVIVI